MVTATGDGYDGGTFTYTSEEVAQAFAALGLDPSANADLVDLAYWHLVDEARATLHGTPAWRARLTELNTARALLSNHFSLWRRPAHPQPDAPVAGTGLVFRRTDRATNHAVRPAHLVAALPLLAALPLAALLVNNQGLAWPERAVAAGAVLLLAAVTAFLIARSGRGRPERAPTGASSPYRLLHLDPHAPPSLASVVYEHLRRAALRHEDAQALAELEHAYARLWRTPASADEPRAGAAHADQTEAKAEEAAPTCYEGGTTGLSGPGRRHRIPLRWLRPWRRTRPPAAARPTASSRRRWPWPRRLPRPVPRRRRTTAPSRPDDPASSLTARPPAAPVTGGEAVWSRRWAGLPAGVLQVRRGAETVLAVPLEDGGVYSIGTAAHCRVVLPEGPGVAAEHARLTVRGGRVRFHHIAETSGSLVNGEPATWLVLEPGDEIRIGPYVCRYLAGDHPTPNVAHGVRGSAPAVHATALPSPPDGST